MPAAITCTDLSFTWPDGRPVLTSLNLRVGPGRTALIGANGSGKSTLLRLIAGTLAPTSGLVRVTGSLGYLPQDLPLARDRRVEDVLGIAQVRGALAAIERGDTSEEHFTTVGDDWDLPDRARATLDSLGLSRLSLDRPLGELSGGECVLLGLSAQLVREPEVLLLDEPTNNLDTSARDRLYAAITAYRGVLLVVTHDRDLLAQVDQIAELREHDVRWYSGDYEAYQHAVAVEQDAAERSVRDAEADLRRQRRQLTEAQTRQDRGARYGRKQAANHSAPRIVLGARKRQAQVSAGKQRGVHEDRIEGARERLELAEAALRQDDTIQIDLPDTAVPTGRAVLELDQARPVHGPPVSLRLRGPERIALVGENGVGKTTLLRTIAGHLPPLDGKVRAPVPVRYLPQRSDLLDDTLSVAENVARFAPQATSGQIRSRLARFLFRGDRAEQIAASLSGGERFRASLAALLLAEPPPQLLLLDEPTNNLDLASVARLTEALAAYRGALVVASHDLPFLRELGLSRWLRLDQDGLAEVAPA
jgi:ATPase subunit of ABC transporter with duplicated ATPase domains